MSMATKRAEDFLLGKERRIKPKHGRAVLSKRTGRTSTSANASSAPNRTQGTILTRPNPPLKKNTALVNIVSAAKKSPEVMVKIGRRKSANSKGVKGVASHIDYISRNGKIELEDNHGLKISGKEVKAIASNWTKAGMIHTQSTKREALNLVLSMPAQVDPEKVRDAARDFAQTLFKGHEYVFALHTDTDHPHVHIAVTMQNERGERLNPRKNDLYQWRLLFAEKMRDQGVECAATKRVHRAQFTKSEKSELWHLKNRQSHSYIEKARFENLKDALKNNKRPVHPFLKEQLQSRNFVVSEYKTLARLLYQENMKTEARILSKMAKEMKNKPPITQAQAQFDKQTRQREPRQEERTL
ncbi:relaxase/mobilization nuclease domain-containing protein [Brackiella oedipodis]|uniref:relaxase/mobilization nuclease domain-containing protein n=1 Tax=Brackiella oedipodis TaxID=124225 RepID=UPI0006890892|nr:relaxase/mobilization nuclease domain-containing protein [Brackiella oedipodis]